jgi:putative hydrolases of HD superfamily
MKLKNENPVKYLEGSAPAIVTLFYEYAHLKQLYRQGWIIEERNTGIPYEKCETVAEHSFGVAFLCCIIANEHFPDLNLEKIIKTALIHDIPEIYSGDITPNDNKSREYKAKKELVGFEKVFSKFEGYSGYLELWKEYENQSTPEARFVRQIDKLEMGLQASLYEKQGYKNLDAFFRDVEKSLTHPILKEIFDYVIKQREK